jgi:hypothetical protein
LSTSLSRSIPDASISDPATGGLRSLVFVNILEDLNQLTDATRSQWLSLVHHRLIAVEPSSRFSQLLSRCRRCHDVGNRAIIDLTDNAYDLMASQGRDGA